MLSFSPSLKLEKALKALQGDIILLAQELSAMDEVAKSWLHKSVLISTIGASTRIENAALTDAEIEWVDKTLTQDGKTTAYPSQRTLILNKLSKDRERSIEEVVGCREMLQLIYIQTDDFFPLTESTIRGMHKILLSYYPKASAYAGGYKTHPNLVISANHETGERHRSFYYAVLQNVSGGQYRADPRDYNLEPLAWFFLKMIQNALEDVILLRRRYVAMTRLSESAHRVLACFKSSPEKRLSLTQLVSETSLVRRTVQNALSHLVKVGFLQRLGAGPSSRYQLIF